MIRNGKYVFGEFVPYEWVAGNEEETNATEEETTTLSEAETSTN